MTRQVDYADRLLNEWPTTVLEKTIEVMRRHVGLYNPKALVEFERALTEAQEQKENK